MAGIFAEKNLHFVGYGKLFEGLGNKTQSAVSDKLSSELFDSHRFATNCLPIIPCSKETFKEQIGREVKHHIIH
ncbi:hypothetical protein M514_08010 [Trichuris suis]|uniref:Uncharacterized protein n=1 Tax=Trichuris suis TaxID=68888 RepID=A0A085N0T3_9BILA|nr:hypothetical protein M514_08010 [Trichuris suis]